MHPVQMDRSIIVLTCAKHINLAHFKVSSNIFGFKDLENSVLVYFQTHLKTEAIVKTNSSLVFISFHFTQLSVIFHAVIMNLARHYYEQ